MLTNLYVNAMTKFNGFVKEEEGQGMVEYGLIIALVAVIAIAGLVLIGPKLSTMFTNISNSL